MFKKGKTITEMKPLLFLILLGFVSALVFADTTPESQDSILVIRQTGPRKLIKAGGNTDAYFEKVHYSVLGIESMQYRDFTILLNDLSDGTYEVQAFRMVICGRHRVNSIFSSLYKSSVEFSYEYDPDLKRILQYHFLFPPNSLTGWANPGDYMIMQKLVWNEPFPSRKCYTDSPVNTSEEFGREYLEAACLPNRESALRFAQKFIDYMRGTRGL